MHSYVINELVRIDRLTTSNAIPTATMKRPTTISMSLFSLIAYALIKNINPAKIASTPRRRTSALKAIKKMPHGLDPLRTFASGRYEAF